MLLPRLAIIVGFAESDAAPMSKKAATIWHDGYYSLLYCVITGKRIETPAEAGVNEGAEVVNFKARQAHRLLIIGCRFARNSSTCLSQPPQEQGNLQTLGGTKARGEHWSKHLEGPKTSVMAHGDVCSKTKEKKKRKIRVGRGGREKSKAEKEKKNENTLPTALL